MHKNKMIVESCQLLSASMTTNGYDGSFKLSNMPKSHYRHPSFLSIVENKRLFIWVLNHSLELCRIYTKRTSKVHKTEEKLNFIRDNFRAYIPQNCHSIFPACDKYNTLDIDAIDIYRRFYVNSKICIASWEHGNKPSWFNADTFNREDAVYFTEKRNKTRKNKITLEMLEQQILDYIV